MCLRSLFTCTKEDSGLSLPLSCVEDAQSSDEPNGHDRDDRKDLQLHVKTASQDGLNDRGIQERKPRDVGGADARSWNLLLLLSMPISPGDHHIELASSVRRRICHCRLRFYFGMEPGMSDLVNNIMFYSQYSGFVINILAARRRPLLVHFGPLEPGPARPGPA